MKHHAILISPTGEEFFSAYGPMTKDKAKASPYVSAEIAQKAALNTFGNGEVFWNSEREAAAKARREYRGWTHRVAPVESAELAEALPV